jgi:FkbM family methyltransferase
MNKNNYELQAESFVFLLKKIFKKDIKFLFELGARDCNESIYFANSLPNANIYSFECNPDTLKACRDKVARVRNLTLVESAVSEVDGEVSFYKINTEKTETTWKNGNPGASSLFQSSGKYEVENYVQDEVKVKSSRLDTFLKEKQIERIDALWMDIQGSELSALKGLGEYITKVSIIHLEVEFFEIYKNQPLFKDIKKFLNGNSFYLYTFTSIGKFSGDAVFINQSTFSNRPLFLFLLFSVVPLVVLP